jgi:hypothetical protein
MDKLRNFSQNSYQNGKAQSGLFRESSSASLLSEDVDGLIGLVGAKATFFRTGRSGDRRRRSAGFKERRGRGRSIWKFEVFQNSYVLLTIYEQIILHDTGKLNLSFFNFLIMMLYIFIIQRQNSFCTWK